MSDEIIKSVQEITLNFSKSWCGNFIEDDAYDSLLGRLGEVVQLTASDESYRMQLASSEELWRSLSAVLTRAREVAHGVMKDRSTSFIFVRTLRGLTLLMRNMSVCNQRYPQQYQFLKECIDTFLRVVKLNCGIDDMLTSYYTITVSFLHNITKDVGANGHIALELLVPFLEYPVEHLTVDQELSYCYAALFLNLAASDELLAGIIKELSCSKIIDGCLLQGIAKHHCIIFKKLDNVKNEDEEYDITSLEAMMLKIFSKLAVHESFCHCLAQLEQEDLDEFFEILKCLQLVVTSSERWDKFELIAIMTWCFPLFEGAAKSTVSYLETKATNEEKAIVLHNKLTITMDIISTLAQYDQVQKYLISYGGLEVLIELLRALQNKLIRINFYKNPNGTVKGLKTTDALGSKLTDEQLLSERIDYKNYSIKATNFPEIKLLVIEILTMLVHNRKDIQDKVRELSGLELVLSNCVIDDNDPFIKERSVVCIKFLLKDNPLNQDFVAKLEAKKPVQDEALSAAGYEVKINGAGELKLKTIDETDSTGHRVDGH